MHQATGWSRIAGLTTRRGVQISVVLGEQKEKMTLLSLNKCSVFVKLWGDQREQKGLLNDGKAVTSESGRPGLYFQLPGRSVPSHRTGREVRGT